MEKAETRMKILCTRKKMKNIINYYEYGSITHSKVSKDAVLNYLAESTWIFAEILGHSLYNFNASVMHAFKAAFLYK